MTQQNTNFPNAMNNIIKQNQTTRDNPHRECIHQSEMRRNRKESMYRKQKTAEKPHTMPMAGVQ